MSIFSVQSLRPIFHQNTNNSLCAASFEWTSHLCGPLLPAPQYHTDGQSQFQGQEKTRTRVASLILLHLKWISVLAEGSFHSFCACIILSAKSMLPLHINLLSGMILIATWEPCDFLNTALLWGITTDGLWQRQRRQRESVPTFHFRNTACRAGEANWIQQEVHTKIDL